MLSLSLSLSFRYIHAQCENYWARRRCTGMWIKGQSGTNTVSQPTNERTFCFASEACMPPKRERTTEKEWRDATCITPCATPLFKYKCINGSALYICCLSMCNVHPLHEIVSLEWTEERTYTAIMFVNQCTLQAQKCQLHPAKLRNEWINPLALFYSLPGWCHLR